MKDLTKKFHQNQPRYGEIDEVERKVCSSAKYEGVEYKLYADDYFSIRSVIETVEKAGLYIESVSFFGDAHGYARVNVFVVEFEESDSVFI